MPTSKTFLPDVNVWLALASARHTHNQTAAGWFDGLEDGQAVFCRITQMGLLRLLTNFKVMGGDTVSPIKAWDVYGRLAGDSRVRFSIEPPGIEQRWHRLTQRPHVTQATWTDTYLHAFAELRELSIATFDKGFRRFDPDALILA